MKIFRKLRQSLLWNSNLKKYLLYAFGEILLVMIGILLALQVNNWNEERKERDKFDQVLVEVENELINNIYACRSVLNNYLFQKDSIANLVLFNELTVDDYRKYPALGEILGSSHSPIIETDAVKKLV